MTDFRKHLSAPGLLSIIHRQFLKVPDPRDFTKNVTISIKDHLMSGLAVFGLKCPSLLDYDRKRSDNVIAENLRDLYHVDNPPSDTYLRERLDHISPDHIRPAPETYPYRLNPLRNPHSPSRPSKGPTPQKSSFAFPSIDGEFIGGCDITTQLYETGELQDLLK